MSALTDEDQSLLGLLAALQAPRQLSQQRLNRYLGQFHGGLR